MSKEIYISSTPHETRLAIVEDEALTEIYYERENEYTLAGSIYNGRVTRVLPGMQSSFVDVGLERDAFLYITDFMEETPDAEEFDTTPAGDRPPRTIQAERSDNGAARSETGSRGESNGRERGGRGRRGGRDRDRDRNPDHDRSDTPRTDTPHAASHIDAGAAEPTAPRDAADSSELGEGAPGADGSRRWRGRRGRRRGRGGPRLAGSPQETTADSANAADPAGTAPAYPDDSSPYAGDERFSESESESDEPFLASESESEIDLNAAAPEAINDRPSQRPDQRSDRGRRDQGRSGSRGSERRNERPDQNRDSRPAQRAPRGFASSRDPYAADSGEANSSTGPIANAYPDADSGPVSEPIVLPGESLSKYRKGDEPSGSGATSGQTGSQPPSIATTVTLAPPANLYTLAEGWDGGATLPGETLSRRRPAESRSDARPDNSRSSDRNSDRNQDREPRRDRDRNSRRGNRPEQRSNQRSEQCSPQSAERRPEHASEHRPNQHPDLHPEHPHAAQPNYAPSSEFVPEPIASAPPAPVETEYEPAEASASFRVDPIARSEYRQSAPVLEPEEVETQPEAEAETVPAHDITSIAATGEMFSEPVEVLPDATPHPAPMDPPEPASPIRHEGAVVSADAEFAPPALGIAAFTPGSGPIDEEVLDEEDIAGATLHASTIEELDDLEEEALEGAADLGTMLREMSIDHITRTEPEVEEIDDADEDDFEEDDLEEDDLDEEDQDDDEEDEGGTFVADQSTQSDEDAEAREQAARTGTAADAEFFEQQFNEAGAEANGAPRNSDSAGASPRDSERRSGRRDGRRDGRRGRSDRGDRSGDRPRSTGGSGERTSFGGGRGRHSMQTTNLPAISDLLKPGQEILVQIAKEPIAKKGARITSHIALPGRFLVFMPTVNHTGVSRKIESDGERRRLKEILLSEKGDASGGFIVRTAAEGASEDELRSDLRFLLNLWADIKARSESSKSPALIYHDLNLVERILRDQVTDNFSAIWVDTEDAYERVLRFLQRFQPSLIRRVKLYLKETPLFEQFGITEEINKALRSKVWLKSGGSIVINQTEALVAIDINTGKFVGKTARLEDTIVKTNLDAIPEIVRQIRLRDLGGIIIIDFIDMDERKNRNRVMAALEDELKNDRAPSKVLQFNDFGLVAITRKRVKQSLERTLSTPCTVCTGTGMVKSPVTVCNDIYIEMRKMHKHLDRGDVMLRVHPEVVKQLKSSGAKWLQEMEEMAGKTILVKSDPSLHPEQFDIH